MKKLTPVETPLDLHYAVVINEALDPPLRVIGYQVLFTSITFSVMVFKQEYSHVT